MLMEVSLEYVSVGCNQTPCSADWNSNGLLAYAAGKSVALAIKGKVSEHKASYILKLVLSW